MPNNEEEETTSLYYRHDYCDADKRIESADDDNLCWSAASANQLWATNWGRLRGIDDEESLLHQVYQQSFPNEAGHNYPSLQWFLEGKGYLTLRQDITTPEDGSAPVVMFSRVPGGFYKDVLRYKNDWATRNIKRLSLLKNHRRLYECVAYLKAGYAVNVNFSRYDPSNGDRQGGHAITLWGIRYSNTYFPNDVRYIKSIIVTDSDDYQDRPSPYHSYSYIEQRNGKGCYEIPVQWNSCQIMGAQYHGAWVLGAGFVGSYDSVLVDSVILAPKPTVYPTPEYEPQTVDNV